MIDKQTIDRIIDAANIVEVVGEFVSLKKRGVNYIGLCPFHNEKTPSFTVSPSKGICKCFGCGNGGNAVNFIMELEHMSYPDALRYLAKKYNIPIQEREFTEEEKQQQTKLESLRIISDYAGKYFHRSLLETDEGNAIGLSYFKERGINKLTIDQFQLGYCSKSGSAFTDEAIKNGYKKELLIDLGLSKQGQYSLFDFFKGRVIFPIHNVSGHVIAFGGRTLENTKKIAKYFNSPESELYHKRNVLYGIFQAKRAISQQDKCYLVEGYTDVTSFHQAGIQNVVASSGTALTKEQIRLIKRFTPNITIIYDGDAAGINAAMKGIDLVIEEEMNVRVVLLPENEDPDSFAKSQSVEELKAYIDQQETDFIHFKTQLLLHEAKNDPVKRAEATRSIVESISKVPDTFLRSEFVKSTARIMELDDEILNTEVRKKVLARMQKNRGQESFNPPQNNQTKTTPTLKTEDTFTKFGLDYFKETEICLLRYLIKFPQKKLTFLDAFDEEQTTTCAEYLFEELMIDEINFQNETYQQIFFLAFEEFRQNQKLTPQFFTQHHDPLISKTCSDIITDRHELSRLFSKQNVDISTEESKLNMLLPNNIIIYKSRSLNKIAYEIETKLQALDTETPEETINEYLENLQRIKSKLKEVSKLVQRVIP